jgi:hypothetical protein
MLRPLAGRGMTAPLGQRRTAGRRHAAGAVGSLAAGFTLSAVTVFGAAGLVGDAFGVSHVPTPVRTWAAIALCVALCAADVAALRSRGLCKVTMRRQTPKNLVYRYGDRVGPLIWGLDTGLAVTTFRVSAATWAILGLTLLNLAPWWLGVAYAAGFCGPLAIAVVVPRWRMERPGEPPREPQWISELLMRVRRPVQAVCLSSLLLIIVTLAGAPWGLPAA